MDEEQQQYNAKHARQHASTSNRHKRPSSLPSEVRLVPPPDPAWYGPPGYHNPYAAAYQQQQQQQQYHPDYYAAQMASYMNAAAAAGWAAAANTNNTAATTSSTTTAASSSSNNNPELSSTTQAYSYGPGGYPGYPRYPPQSAGASKQVHPLKRNNNNNKSSTHTATTTTSSNSINNYSGSGGETSGDEYESLLKNSSNSHHAFDNSNNNNSTTTNYGSTGRASPSALSPSAPRRRPPKRPSNNNNSTIMGSPPPPSTHRRSQSEISRSGGKRSSRSRAGSSDFGVGAYSSSSSSNLLPAGSKPHSFARSRSSGSLTGMNSSSPHHKRQTSYSGSVFSQTDMTDASMMTMVTDIGKSDLFAGYDKVTGQAQLALPASRIFLQTEPPMPEDGNDNHNNHDDDEEYQGHLYQLREPDLVFENYHKVSEDVQFGLGDDSLQMGDDDEPAANLLPPAQYVMTVPHDLYRRVIDDVAESAHLPCGLFFCGHHEDVARPSVMIPAVFMILFFCGMGAVAVTYRG